MRGRIAIVLSLLAVAAVFGVQLASGGGDFVPRTVAGPCVARPLPPQTDDPDRLVQAIVLIGVQRAACTLGVSRDELLVSLPSASQRGRLLTDAGRREDELVPALKAGLSEGVGQLERAGRLPSAAELISRYGAEAGVPGLALDAIERLPPAAIERYLPVGETIRGAISALDPAAVLADLDDLPALQDQLEKAVAKQAVDHIKEQISDDVSSSIGRLFGLG